MRLSYISAALFLFVLYISGQTVPSKATANIMTAAMSCLDIHKATELMPNLTFYGDNYRPENQQERCATFSVLRLNSTHVEYRKHSKVSNNVHQTVYYGSFFKTHSTSEGQNGRSYLVFDSVTVRTHPGTHGGTNYSMVYSDCQTCSILRPHHGISDTAQHAHSGLNLKSKCRVLLKSSATNDGPSEECLYAFITHCGPVESLVRALGENCNHN
uniref:Lipocalin/cytosolic fatty-acid binding domain-containing protein n=1 Tax=Amblyomma maculatum TaxID=34609 RepID=G3MR64_AMBMU